MHSVEWTGSVRTVSAEADERGNHEVRLRLHQTGEDVLVPVPSNLVNGYPSGSIVALTIEWID
jgi:hypothetical protein